VTLTIGELTRNELMKVAWLSCEITVRVYRKKPGVECSGIGAPLGVGSGKGADIEFFFEFSSKQSRVLCIFIAKNYT